MDNCIMRFYSTTSDQLVVMPSTTRSYTSHSPPHTVEDKSIWVISADLGYYNFLLEGNVLRE